MVLSRFTCWQTQRAIMCAMMRIQPRIADMDARSDGETEPDFEMGDAHEAAAAEAARSIRILPAGPRHPGCLPIRVLRLIEKLGQATCLHEISG